MVAQGEREYQQCTTQYYLLIDFLRSSGKQELRSLFSFVEAIQYSTSQLIAEFKSTLKEQLGKIKASKHKLVLQTPLTTTKLFSYGVRSLCKVLS